MASIINIISVVPMLLMNTVTILIDRLIIGISIGLDTTLTPIYIIEISLVEISGILGSLF